MMITYLTRFWKELVLVCIAVISVWYVMHLRMKVQQLTADNVALHNEIDNIQTIAYAAEEKYQKDIVKYENLSKQVEIKWKSKKETVYIWRDNNVSCEDSMAKLNSATY